MSEPAEEVRLARITAVTALAGPSHAIIAALAAASAALAELVDLATPVVQSRLEVGSRAVNSVTEVPPAAAAVRFAASTAG
jgi:hypothetical protein